MVGNELIRLASTDDIPSIRKMASEVFPLTYRDILSNEQIEYMMDMMYSKSSLMHQMCEAGNIFYICDGRGFVSYRHDSFLPDSIELFHLEKLYVMPDAQGKGLGRRLFDTVVCAARQSSEGAVRIELNVNRHNKAVSFYEHIGMRKERKGDFPIGKGFYMNDYIMTMDF